MPNHPVKRALWAAALLGLATPALADRAPASDELDISADKAKLKLITDGKSHYLLQAPFTSMETPMLYSSDGGKTFYQQRVYGGGSSGDGKGADDSFDRVYWDPRAQAPYKASFSFRAGKYEILCEERKTELKPVADADAAKILGAAKFFRPRWKFQAYALARDNTGKYFFVDRAREPEGNKNFRLFAGNKGSLKLQKMTNVVSDSEGDIFATKTGSLRLILNKGESLWQQGAKKEKLVLLPVEDNHVLIYTDLGVYTGQPLGTPCDDL